jgi:hypothetical protein
MAPGWPERLGLDLDAGGEADLQAWLVACMLRAHERREAVVERAVARLTEAGLLDPAARADAAGRVADCLEAAGVRRPEVAGARLSRVGAALRTRHGGSLEALAAGALSLEELGGALVGLGPGLGPGTAARFLRPLRIRWTAADGLGLEPTAFAAAVHLGWLDAGDDPDEAPARLRRRLAADAPEVPWTRVEDALGRLGRFCRRSDTRSCPLGDACPGR